MDDDPAVPGGLVSVLADRGLEVLTAGTAAEGEGVLASQEVDLLVLDLFLPDADGREVLRTLRARSATATLPVIVLTGRSGQELGAECFELGADGFVEKPVDAALLASEIQSQLQRAGARERPALLDPLTGLLNFAGLLDAIASLEGRPRSLVMGELDGLRAIWSRYGWTTTESIVTKVGHALARAFPDALLARPAGGEFFLVLDSVDQGRIDASARRLLEEARRVASSGPDGETFRLTASVGAIPDAGDGDPRSLVASVRSRVERVAASGGNRVWVPEASAGDPEAHPLVLVAEDDDITAKILAHRLEKDAFRVLRFENGQEAYRRALDETPALVLLDVKMPGMDGFEILSRLRKTPSYDGVPIVMLTSMGNESDVVRGFGLGADDYILKPFSPAELVARLRRLLRRGHTPA